MSRPVDGILLLHHRPLVVKGAATVVEHVEAFRRHSRFDVWEVNTEEGFPPGLRNVRFSVVVLHYSLFASLPFYLGQEFQDYLAHADRSYKIAFFQDEHRFCQPRFELVDRIGIDCIYTLLDPPYADQVYRHHASVSRTVSTLPGFVADSLIDTAQRLRVRHEQRKIDIGYRARPLDFYMGRGAQEKTDIAQRFIEHAGTSGLRLDVEWSESSRFYGDDWHRFTADCMGVLGVESGTSIFDLDGTVKAKCDALLAVHPEMSFEEMSERVLEPHEDKIPYRTISPRVFEAAAFECCQILFEGHYSGVLEPWTHYIPLRKDFANFDEVIDAFRDRATREAMVTRAYRDLIASSEFNYRQFISRFDAELGEIGISPGPKGDTKTVSRDLRRGSARGRLMALGRGLMRSAVWRLPSGARNALRNAVSSVDANSRIT